MYNKPGSIISGTPSYDAPLIDRKLPTRCASLKPSSTSNCETLWTERNATRGASSLPVSHELQNPDPTLKFEDAVLKSRRLLVNTGETAYAYAMILCRSLGRGDEGRLVRGMVNCVLVARTGHGWVLPKMFQR